MDASGDAAALRVEEQQATSSRTDFVTAQIELSKRHWSELSKPISREDAAKAKLDNEEQFKTWDSHPKWGECFFARFGGHHGICGRDGSLEVGEKFAEGAQAELFHVHVRWKDSSQTNDDSQMGTEWVLKVFKEGTLVRDLQLQWPEGLFRQKHEALKRRDLGIPGGYKDVCDVHCATLLEDGRFAFLLQKEDGDLRSLIERNMAESDNGCGPFSKELGEEIMYRVAKGMDCLHSYDIIHRGLKASNVLVKASRPSGKYLWCYVADFESSIGVVGTRFWTAPEILRACREGKIWESPELFTKEADIYSYGMTCYEVLTGRIPFQDHPLIEEPSLLMGLVIDQQLRPEVPDYVEDWARKLLERCWRSDRSARPSFKEILDDLEANSKSEYIQALVSKRLQPQEQWKRSGTHRFVI